jgi:FHS family L-fucose permease-like MFS transporter
MAIAPQGKINTSTTSGTSQNYSTALYSLMVLFFMMGFITCLNNILIPYMKVLFVLKYWQVNLINLCFFGAYGIMSIPGGKLVQKYGYKPIMIAGFLIAAVGCGLFYPAAEVRMYGLFLGALFVLGSGLTLLQVAGNPYVAILGSPETSSSRLTLTQALNSLGTTVGPLVGGSIILANLPEMPDALKAVKGYDNLPSELNLILIDFLEKIDLSYLQVTYIIIASVFALLGVVLYFIKLPAIGHGEGEIDTDGEIEKSSIWGYKQLVLGAVGIFVYVGAEVSIGSHIISYLGMNEVMAMTAKQAGGYVTFYWGAAMVGRFLGTIILAKFNPGKTLGVYGLMAISLLILSIISTGFVSMWTLLMVGFCNSLMFPTIFTLSIKGLGKYTEQGSGILCTAIVGGALIPLLFGTVADLTGGNLKLALLIPILCYFYISYFGFKGHKTREL